MELGLYTFAETTPSPDTGHIVSASQRLGDLMAEIELADQLGLEVFGVGEQHSIELFGTQAAPAVRRATAASIAPAHSAR